jgi:hypothetical protein
MSSLPAFLPADLGGDTMKSLADIISIVRFRGDMRSSVRFPDANLTTEIQASWAELYQLIAQTNQGYWDTVSTVFTIAGVDYSPLPDSTWIVRKISRLEGTSYVPMDQIGIDEIDNFAPTGRPFCFRPTERGVDLYPTPDAVYTLRFVTTPLAPQLNEAREFFNGWEEFVIYGALIRLAANSERDITAWERQLEKARVVITGGASQRKAQEPDYIPIRETFYDGQFSRDERWR